MKIIEGFTRTQYGDAFISGRLRNPKTDFTGSQWKEVRKPGPEYGRRVAA